MLRLMLIRFGAILCIVTMVAAGGYADAACAPGGHCRKTGEMLVVNVDAAATKACVLNGGYGTTCPADVPFSGTCYCTVYTGTASGSLGVGSVVVTITTDSDGTLYSDPIDPLDPGVCSPLFASFNLTLRDGETLDFNANGSQCPEIINDGLRYIGGYSGTPIYNLPSIGYTGTFSGVERGPLSIRLDGFSYALPY